MLLVARYRHAFSAKVVDKGLDYFFEGYVDTLRLAGSQAEADVEGSGRKPYLVRILAGQEPVCLSVDCTCPHADRGHFCKHIYASLLELGDPALQFPVPGSGRIDLHFLAADAIWDMSSAHKHRPSEQHEIWSGEDTDDEDERSDWDDDFDDDLDHDVDFRIDVANPSAPRGYVSVSRPGRVATRPPPRADDWSARIEGIADRADRSPRPLVGATSEEHVAPTLEVVFRIDLPRCLVSGNLTLEFLQRRRAADGSTSDLEPISLHPRDPALAQFDVDQKLLGQLLALPETESDSNKPWAPTGNKVPGSRSHAVVPEAYYAVLLPELAATGRLLAEPPAPQSGTSLNQARTNRALIPVAWDTGPAWRFGLEIERGQTAETPKAETALVQLHGTLERAGMIRPLSDAWLLMQRGLVLFEGTLATLESPEVFSWVVDLRSRGRIELPLEEADALIAQLVEMPDLPQIRGLETIGWQCVSGRPRPVLHVEVPTVRERRPGQRAPSAAASLRFEYVLSYPHEPHEHPHEQQPNERSAAGEIPTQEWVVLYSDPREIFAHPANRYLLQRDREAEAELGLELIDLGARARRMSTESRFEMPRYVRDGEIAEAEIPLSRFSEVIHALLERGWKVEADGTRWRRAHSSSIRVSSGIDWFELRGSVDFGDAGSAELPELLAALERGERVVRLGDGSHGLLPEEWLRQVAPLKQLGELEGDLLRFAPSQATLLDALLTAREQDGDTIEVDARFGKLRKRLRGRQQIRARSAPKGFRGELREYQQEGLAWLYFLNGLGLGGCLADDMGLGKTIQVLALLEGRRVRRLQKGEDRLPSLVVAPTSVVHNWRNEAARFTPKLKVLDYTGKDRAGLLDEFAGAHLILTSYGTLRRDIAKLADRRFDYAILDEAQAIKNDKSQTAKSARLLRASHRLVLTGTPVENHLGELFSLFEFLNPGLLGRNPALRKLVGSRDPKDAETLVTLTEALRPLILRRNKEDVLSELPSKTEQTLYCDLPPSQRRQYDQLRKRYRDSLLGRVADKGMSKSKIQVLEALLRLRQAACHPGLIDDAKLGQSSAKLEVLLEQLEEVVAEGHKVLVYSQFTKLLKIVRQRLDAKKMTYEYLDGHTRKREERVERFQTDPACPVFLISLKAGGVGLNLTAADYVFILDPWWNPAAEAQAIDRAHRMGQERPVFAYRIIARDTVEERILELQERKRGIADAIITAEGGVLRELSLDDLRALLG